MWQWSCISGVQVDAETEEFLNENVDLSVGKANLCRTSYSSWYIMELML